MPRCGTITTMFFWLAAKHMGLGAHHRVDGAPPTEAYWRWAQTSQAPLVTVTAALPPCPWIAIPPSAVAKFKYPAECSAHKCPGHPNKWPLYYSLDTVGTLPAELSLAVHTHLREHHGDLAPRVPHGRATDPPHVLAPEVQPGIWFHDLPVLATLRGTASAVDAGATRADMSMAVVAQSRPTAYRAHVASGVGTSQEGEAMILLSSVGRLAQQPEGYIGWCRIRRRQWGPFARTKRGAIVETAYITSRLQSWEASASPRSQPSTWLPRPRTG